MEWPEDMSGTQGEACSSAGYAYDTFASYATDPDRDLVRALESIVEGFHRRRSIPNKMRQELELCVDGRDFLIPRRARGQGNPAAVFEIVESYMRKCRSLLVLTGPLSRLHPWINHEIEWWLKNRPDGPIYFALTHGSSMVPEEIYPPALIKNGGGDLPIFFDLRGFYARPRWWRSMRWSKFSEKAPGVARSAALGWKSVRPFEEEAAKVAARLLADALSGEFSLDAIEAAWAADEARARKRRMAAAVIAATGSIAAAAAVGSATITAVDARRTATAETWLQRARALVDQGGAAVPSALAYAGSALVRRPSAEATGMVLAASENLVPIERILKPDGGDPAWTAEHVEEENFILVGGRSGILRAIDLNDGTVLWRADLKSSGIRIILYEPKFRTAIVGTDRGLVRLRLPRRGDKDGAVELARALPDRRVGGLVVDVARRRVLVGLLQSGEIWSFPLEDAARWDGRRLTTILDPRFARNGSSDVQSGVYGMSLKADRLVVTGIDGVVSVLHAGAVEAAPRQFVHPEAVFAMTVSQSGRELVLVDDDGGISVYNLETSILLRAGKGSTVSASVARSLRGAFAIGGTDKLANVGVALNSDDTVLAVTSHDRSVRFMTFADLAPVGSAIHRSAPRAVVFGKDGKKALTLSDDGSIQVVRPTAQPEVLRLAEIDGFAVNAGSIVAWPVRPRSKAGYQDAGKVISEIFAVSAGSTTAVSIGKVDDDPWSAIIVEGIAALRPASSTRIHLLALPGSATLPCRTLQHSNVAESVDVVRHIRPGPEEGTIVTLSERQGQKVSFLNVWSLRDCSIVRSFMTSGPFSVAESTVVTAPETRRLEVRSPSSAQPDAIRFEGDIHHVSVAAKASSILVTLRSPGAVCLCTRGVARREGRRSQVCSVHSEHYTCRPVPATMPTNASGDPEGPIAAELSPSGHFAVAQHRSALQLIGSRASKWTFREASPAQLRPVTPPFAFSADEQFLAVPAGETGARLLDSKTAQSIADLPTPSRVLKIAFANDAEGRLLTLDGGILRMWDSRPAAVLTELCKRWNPDLSINAESGITSPLSRQEICGSDALSPSTPASDPR